MNVQYSKSHIKAKSWPYNSRAPWTLNTVASKALFEQDMSLSSDVENISQTN